ncbi:flagellar L-ring protein [Thermodesulfatator indicus DSM 15286]|uniref:Flagellar L-ring protein n=1 Tax=Thermodesulfatator indicus (strain DSM 15286 / JCM 11887 / CIR29812) TaxID=667014 RepID=F8AAR3_THEID|nr:flagellar basal body L-ring protein FlgH [Thermodesulfatator indicus]AEH44345.1 flagellar L-ring protein [Thermodesulfatator indicus DSM 15286]
MVKKLTILSALLLVLGLSACGPPKNVAIEPPPPPKVYVPVSKQEKPKEGSLYAGNQSFFFEDHRARRVGDVITVKILENYQSSSKVSNKIARKSEANAGVKAMLGFEKALEESNRRFQADPMFSGGINTSTDGQGQLSRATNIVATITARVVQVLPNGNLVIQGVRTVRQDENLEYITITGIVRPEDIAADNTVLSTQIADARIEYSGRGPAALATRGPGWLSRALQVIWPF